MAHPGRPRGRMNKKTLQAQAELARAQQAQAQAQMQAQRAAAAGQLALEEMEEESLHPMDNLNILPKKKLLVFNYMMKLI